MIYYKLRYVANICAYAVVICNPQHILFYNKMTDKATAF